MDTYSLFVKLKAPKPQVEQDARNIQEKGTITVTAHVNEFGNERFHSFKK